MDITPIFVSRYSITASTLTLEEPGKTKEGLSPSIFDLAAELKLKDVTLVDTRIDGMIEAYKSAEKAGVKLCYGVKFTVCSDMSVKDDESLKTESRIIVLTKCTEGQSQLIRIWNKAATDGSYYEPRIDWKTLKELWNDNLILALPFFGSFIEVNTLTFNRVVPNFPVKPIIFSEIDSGLPFAKLIDAALITYIKEAQIPAENVVNTKTILYRNRSDFESYMTLRCIGNKSAFDKPNINHLSSDSFCWEAYKELIK